VSLYVPTAHAEHCVQCPVCLQVCDVRARERARERVFVGERECVYDGLYCIHVPVDVCVMCLCMLACELARVRACMCACVHV
jgi:hypothetical protein